MIKKSFLLAFLMIFASAAAVWLTPKGLSAKTGVQLNLDQALPAQFGDWRLEAGQGILVVNPQQTESIEAIYSQTVSRTYVRSDGYRIMLSIAYGDDQSRDSQLHKPETCYAAQGFGLKFSRPATLKTRFGSLESTRLFAIQGTRMEPITYWMRVGDVVLRGGLQQTIQRVKLGLFKGVVPDGLLFRISDISGDPEISFQRQEAFARDFLEASSSELRLALLGNPS